MRQKHERYRSSAKRPRDERKCHRLRQEESERRRDGVSSPSPDRLRMILRKHRANAHPELSLGEREHERGDGESAAGRRQLHHTLRR